MEETKQDLLRMPFDFLPIEQQVLEVLASLKTIHKKLDRINEEVVAIYSTVKRLHDIGIVVPFPEKIEDFLSISIDELNVSVRTYNCLTKVGVKTVGDIVRMSEEDLFYGLKNFGKKSLMEIKMLLAEMGLALRK